MLDEVYYQLQRVGDLPSDDASEEYVKPALYLVGHRKTVVLAICLGLWDQ
jgi:hypothetical protein